MSAFASQRRSSKRAADQSSQATSFERIAEILQKGCLAVCLIGVPLTTAWAMESGIVAFWLASVVLASVGAIRVQRSVIGFRGSLIPVYVAGLGCLLVAAQLLQLPPSLLKHISPVQQSLFAEWGQLHDALSTPAEWQTISLTPALTKSSLILGLGYLAFVVGLVLFLSSWQNVKWLIRVVAVSAGLMAAVGLAQLLAGNGKFLWCFENPMRSAGWPAKGTFTNQNHFAGFLSLGFGPCLLLVLGYDTKRFSGQGKPERRPAGEGDSIRFDSVQKGWAVVTMILLLAGLLSFSRGGILSMLVSIAICCIFLRGRLNLVMRFIVPALTFCILGLFAFGTEAFSSKWDLLVTSSSLTDVSAARVALWQSLVDAIPSFAMAGAGAGSHAEVYPIWLEQDFGMRFSHAENGYLQLLVEMGIPGALLLVFGLYSLTRGIVFVCRNGRDSDRVIAGVCAAGLISGLAHSLMDFVWYIPAYLIVTLTLAVLLFRISDLCHVHSEALLLNSRRRFGYYAPVLVLLLIVPLSCWALPRAIADANSEADWLSYRGAAIAAERFDLGEGLLPEHVNGMIGALESCLKKDSTDYRAMSELAVMYLRRFEMSQADGENPMTLAEIRNTVQSVRFESHRKMLQWMTTAFGDGVGDLFRAAIVARKSIDGQPLRASPYLVLHQLSFMISTQDGIEDLLMDQALRVRPHDAAIRYAAGIADIESGRLDEGYQKLSFAFHKDIRLRGVILNQMADILNLRELVSVLHPDLDATTQVFEVYLDRADPVDLQWIAERFRAEFAQSKRPQQSKFWYSAAAVFEYLGDNTAEVAALKKALLLSPQAYANHRRVALRISEVSEHDKAISALKRCLIRNPEDQVVKRRLSELMNTSVLNSAGLTN